MKVIRVLSVVALLLVASASFSLAAPGDGPSSVDAAWANAFKANDLEATVACYAPDAILWLPEAPEFKGTAAIRDGYKGFFAANKVQDVSTKEFHRETTGNRSISWGTFSMTVLPNGAAKPVTETGRYTEVTENRGGKWVYVVDHASTDPAPAAAPAKK
jgi:ketosteroid isomerase-like protein